MKKPRFDPSISAEENARQLLTPQIRAYFEAGRKAATGTESASDLHRFRLEGKRLRYAMELFAPCYGPGLDRYLALLRGAQTRLGDLNDCDAAARLIGELKVATAHRKKAAQFLEARSGELRAEFERFWREELDAAGVEKRWMSYAGRPRTGADGKVKKAANKRGSI